MLTNSSFPVFIFIQNKHQNMSNCKYVCNRFVFVVIYSLTKFVTYLLTQIGNIKHTPNKTTTISVKNLKMLIKKPQLFYKRLSSSRACLYTTMKHKNLIGLSCFLLKQLLHPKKFNCNPFSCK